MAKNTNRRDRIARRRREGAMKCERLHLDKVGKVRGKSPPRSLLGARFHRVLGRLGIEISQDAMTYERSEWWEEGYRQTHREEVR